MRVGRDRRVHSRTARRRPPSRPRRAHPERAAFLQWLHFAESTAFPPLGIIAWLSRYRGENERYADLIADSRSRAADGFAFLERALGDRRYVLGPEFSGADIMLGFTLIAGRIFGVLDDRYPVINAYLERLQARPALAEDDGDWVRRVY